MQIIKHSVFVYRFMWNIGWQKYFVNSDVVVIITIRRKTQLTGEHFCGSPLFTKTTLWTSGYKPSKTKMEGRQNNWRGWHCTFTLKPEQSSRFQGNPERPWIFQDTETIRKNNSLSIQEICNNEKLDFIHFKDDNIYLVTFTDMNTASKLLHRISSNSDRQCL